MVSPFAIRSSETRNASLLSPKLLPSCDLSIFILRISTGKTILECRIRKVRKKTVNFYLSNGTGAEWEEYKLFGLGAGNA